VRVQNELVFGKTATANQIVMAHGGVEDEGDLTFRDGFQNKLLNIHKGGEGYASYVEIPNRDSLYLGDLSPVVLENTSREDFEGSLMFQGSGIPIMRILPQEGKQAVEIESGSHFRFRTSIYVDEPPCYDFSVVNNDLVVKYDNQKVFEVKHATRDVYFYAKVFTPDGKVYESNPPPILPKPRSEALFKSLKFDPLFAEVDDILMSVEFITRDWANPENLLDGQILFTEDREAIWGVICPEIPPVEGMIAMTRADIVAYDPPSKHDIKVGELFLPVSTMTDDYDKMNLLLDGIWLYQIDAEEFQPYAYVIPDAVPQNIDDARHSWDKDAHGGYEFNDLNYLYLLLPPITDELDSEPIGPIVETPEDMFGPALYMFEDGEKYTPAVIIDSILPLPEIDLRYKILADVPDMRVYYYQEDFVIEKITEDFQVGMLLHIMDMTGILIPFLKVLEQYTLDLARADWRPAEHEGLQFNDLKYLVDGINDFIVLPIDTETVMPDDSFGPGL
jgi:hypothetical protein